MVVTAAPADIFPPTVKRFETVAADKVASPLIVAAFQTLSDEIVVVPPEMVPDTTRLFCTVAADRVVSPLIVTSPDTDTLDRAARPLTVTPLLIVTASDRVDTPITVIDPVVMAFVTVADDRVAVADPADRVAPWTVSVPCAVSRPLTLNVSDTNPVPETFRA